MLFVYYWIILQGIIFLGNDRVLSIYHYTTLSWFHCWCLLTVLFSMVLCPSVSCLTILWIVSPICQLFLSILSAIIISEVPYWPYATSAVSAYSNWPLCCWRLIWPTQNDAKKLGKCLKSWHMGTHLRVLSESYPMNTNMIGFRWFSKIFASLCFGRKVASASEGLKHSSRNKHNILEFLAMFFCALSQHYLATFVLSTMLQRSLKTSKPCHVGIHCAQ